MSEPPIRIETLNTAVLTVEQQLVLPSASDAAVDRQPVRPGEVWNLISDIPATPPPALKANGDVYQVMGTDILRLKLRRPLAAAAGGPPGAQRYTGDITQAVPRSFDAASAADPPPSAAPLLAAPQGDADGYRPVIEDAAGTAHVQDPAVWIVDFAQQVVEFPRGVPEDFVEPLTLTYYAYAGPVGGTAAAGPPAPPTPVPQALATSGGTPQAISPLATLVQITIDNAVEPTVFTLADGAAVGHELAVVVVGDSGGGKIHVAPANLTGPYSALEMDGVGFSARLAWTAAGAWAAIGGTGARGVA